MILKFKNHVFKEGINITVRRGVKWANESKAQIEAEENQVTRPVPIRTYVMRFKDLNEIMIANEHDPKCRKVDGLLEVMKNVYPGFDPKEIVTIVEWDNDRV